jgi:hypothetical protein
MRSRKKAEETSMAWYVSYRTGGSAVMHVFKRREHAIAAASEFLDRGYRDALEVGPMSENPEGKLLDERDLRRIWDKSSGAATPAPAASAGSSTSSRT